MATKAKKSVWICQHSLSADCNACRKPKSERVPDPRASEDKDPAPPRSYPDTAPRLF